MKKLKLNQNSFAGAEVLTRAQLKKVMGGSGSGGCGGSGTELKCQCLNNYRTFTCDDTYSCMWAAESACGMGVSDYICASGPCS